MAKFHAGFSGFCASFDVSLGAFRAHCPTMGAVLPWPCANYSMQTAYWALCHYWPTPWSASSWIWRSWRCEADVAHTTWLRIWVSRSLSPCSFANLQTGGMPLHSLLKSSLNKVRQRSTHSVQEIATIWICLVMLIRQKRMSSARCWLDTLFTSQRPLATAKTRHCHSPVLRCELAPRKRG